jgi:hypothetical protein
MMGTLAIDIELATSAASSLELPSLNAKSPLTEYWQLDISINISSYVPLCTVVKRLGERTPVMRESHEGLELQQK